MMTETMDIPEMLREADKSWNVGTIAETIVKILTENPGMTMLDIEDHLRTLGSKTTYLVAWPSDRIPPIQGCPMIPKNFVTGETMPYGLWVCINGPDDMLKQLEVFGLTAAENRVALQQCGFNTIGDSDEQQS